MTMTRQQFSRLDNRREIALGYTKGSPMLDMFLRMNGYNRIVVQRHHLSEPCWQVWMMNGESTGTYTLHRTRRDAKQAALRLSEHTGLPVASI